MLRKNVFFSLPIDFVWLFQFALHILINWLEKVAKEKKGKTLIHVKKKKNHLKIDSTLLQLGVKAQSALGML